MIQLKTIIILCVMFIMANGFSQEITTNRKPVGLEHNLLFNAESKYTVTQTGSCQLSLPSLFDGKFLPSYSSTGPTDGDPFILEISGLPLYHTQRGAWVGWSTRYWPALRFKIEGFESYYANSWVTIADYQNTNYTESDFVTQCPPGMYTKLRLTVYEASGVSGRLGISEFFYIHPEAVRPYEGLFSSDLWTKNGSSLSYTGGNIGIGTNSPSANFHIYKSYLPLFRLENDISRLDVSIATNPGECDVFSKRGDVVYRTLHGDKNDHHGLIFSMPNDDDDGNSYIKFTDLKRCIMAIKNDATVRIDGKLYTKEMHVKTNVWSDFVFEDGYKMPTLKELEKYINKNKHLPNIPTEKEVKENGINVAKMNALLLQKVEELTLYLIDQDKKIEKLEKEIENLKKN